MFLLAHQQQPAISEQKLAVLMAADQQMAQL
jgi:hypothetical protein